MPQPYVNPNYFQQTVPVNYQPYQAPTNPYLDRSMSGFQQSYQVQQPIMQQNTSQPQTVPSRIVDNFEQITANDVPMDNMGAIFIKRDGSELQHRVWSGNGSINMTSYLPQIEAKTDNASILSPEEQKTKFEAFESVLSGISEKVDAITDKLEELYSKKTTRTKKEAEEE